MITRKWMIPALILGLVVMPFTIRAQTATTTDTGTDTPPVVNLDDSGGNVVVRQTGAHYSTIQAAIDAASSGDTIDVGAGTYNENVVVSKPITLNGAGSGTTVINGGTQDSAIRTTADSNVTVQGFTLSGGAGIHPYGIYNGSDITGLTVTNNTFTNNSAGILLRCADSCTISGNVFSDNGTYSGPSQGRALDIMDSSHLTMENNQFDGNSVAVFFEADSSGTRHTNFTFRNNTVSNQDVGLKIPSLDTGTISGNTFSRVNSALIMDGGVSNVSVMNNSFTDGVGAILVSNPNNLGVNSNITLSGNTYSNNSDYNLRVENGAYDGSLTSDEVSTSGIVTIRQTGAHYRTIQAAIDAAGAGNDIDVGPGTYSENILIDKPLQLHGSSATSTTIDGHGSGATIRLNSDNVTIEGFTIMGGEGHGPNDLDAGIWSLADNANLRINNNTITDNALGIYIICKDNCQINSNTIRDNNRQSRVNPLAALYVVSSNNLTVQGNDISGHINNNVFITFSENGHTNLRFMNNVIHDNEGSIFVAGLNGATFTGNEIFNTKTTGIDLLGSNQNVNISGNTVRDTGIGGILVSKVPSLNSNGNFTLSDNTYARNTQYNVCVENGAYNGSLASDPENCGKGQGGNATNTPPVVTLNGSSTVDVLIHGIFEDPGVTITDDHDTNLSAIIGGHVDFNVLGAYTRSYFAVDSQGATSTPVFRTINIVSTTTSTSTATTTTSQTNNNSGGGGSTPLVFGIGGRQLGVGNAFFLPLSQLFPGIPNTGVAIGTEDTQSQIDSLRAQIAQLLSKLIILLQEQISISSQ
ncbi:right-handed parallel beta-helix repeat-containing protein [Candidatus Parcubacteria bacterium]|nr:right-handed parallel beta-helix repeat-containing protein [Candidatus Parcubacteria bacterium]